MRRRFAILALPAQTSLISAASAYPPVPLTRATSTQPRRMHERTNIGASIESGSDGRENAAARRAHRREDLANEAAARLSALWMQPPRRQSSLPIVDDGRTFVFLTSEVAAAKAAHANELRLKLANEAAWVRCAGPVDSMEIDDSITETTIDPDGGSILDAPELAALGAAHANERFDLAYEAARSGDGNPTRVVDANRAVLPLSDGIVLGDGAVVALVPVGLDGRRTLDATKVAAREHRNLANDVKSADALAIAGATLTYGSLVY